MRAELCGSRQGRGVSAPHGHLAFCSARDVLRPPRPLHRVMREMSTEAMVRCSKNCPIEFFKLNLLIIYTLPASKKDLRWFTINDA